MVCQCTSCQLCRQPHQCQGRGSKRTIFLLVKTRRTNWQSSCPSVVTENSSTIVTGCTDKVVHQSVYISRELSQLKRVTSEERLTKPMEGKCDHQIKQTNERENVMINKYQV